MTFEVTILGSNSAIPAHGRHPTAQVLNHNEKFFLLDCGECTQMLLSQFKIRRSKIDHIFISHLHGDHYYGLRVNHLSLVTAQRTSSYFRTEWF
jgi:ribonuclease Z